MGAGVDWSEQADKSPRREAMESSRSRIINKIIEETPTNRGRLLSQINLQPVHFTIFLSEITDVCRRVDLGASDLLKEILRVIFVTIDMNLLT